jgi:DNA-binding response OmpR family regulator
MKNAALTVGAERPIGKVFIQVGGSSVNLRSGTTQNGKGLHHLRPKELELLTFLYQNNGTVFSRDELLRLVWNHPRMLVTRTVDQTVATLRRKLNDSAARPRYLITVHGMGYQLRSELETNFYEH